MKKKKVEVKEGDVVYIQGVDIYEYKWSGDQEPEGLPVFEIYGGKVTEITDDFIRLCLTKDLQNPNNPLWNLNIMIPMGVIIDIKILK